MTRVRPSSPHRSAAPGRDSTERGKSHLSGPRERAHDRSRLGTSRRRTRQRRAPPSTARERGTKAARVRSGFVPETRAKSAEFAGIRFSSLRGRQRGNVRDLQAESRRDIASSAVCHAEGRGSSPFSRSSGSPANRGVFCCPEHLDSPIRGVVQQLCTTNGALEAAGPEARCRSQQTRKTNAEFGDRNRGEALVRSPRS